MLNTSFFLLFLLFYRLPDSPVSSAGKSHIVNDSYNQGMQDTVAIGLLDQMNSPWRESNPSVTPDGKFLFFMSGRGGNPWNSPEYTSFRGKVEPDGDIFFSRRKDGNWTAPVNLGNSINTSMGEDEPNISPDGQHVIFQSWKEGWEKTGGPYYRSELKGDAWGKPTGLGGEIHRFFMDKTKANDGYYATDGSCLSPDGNLFIFAAGKWYDEPMDLYISLKRKGKWTYPVKMALSTEADDRSVFIAADNRTLFFSSEGYGGYGGLDIYRTLLDDDGKNGAVVNIGQAFNTDKDDFGFTMNAEGTEVFFSVDGDLVQAVFANPPGQLLPLPTMLINGIVTDYDGRPVEADIRILKAANRDTVARAKSNALSGEYSIVFQKDEARFIKEINANQFTGSSEMITVKDPESGSRLESRDFLKRADSELIFFDFNDPSVRKREMDKLDSIANWLYNHKNSRLLLTGHTDQPGTEDYNLELSRERVKNVKSYFEGRGIPGRIIRTEYRGESQPLQVHPGGEEDEMNRRVEIRIILNEE